MKRAIHALRFIAALILVVICRVLGIPVGRSGQRRMDAALMRAAARARQVDRIPTARRRDADAGVNLRRVRAWYTVSKVSDLNNLWAQIFEDAIFVAREVNLMSALVTGYTAEGMATRSIPIYPSLTAQETVEGVDYSNATLWEKTLQAIFTPKIIKTQVILTDERLMSDPDGARNDAAIEMGGAISTKIDEDLCALFPNFTTDKGTAGSALTIRRCAAGLAVLRNNKVRGAMNVVLHPFGWHAVWVELGQPTANQAFLGEVANQAMRDYGVGNFLAASWYTDANISVDGSDDAVSAVFTREALALDTRSTPEIEPERDASLPGWELNGRARYAVGTRRANYGVKLTHDAAEPS